MFIYLVVAQVNFWPRRNDKGELNSFASRPAVLKENRPDSRQDELPNGLVRDRGFLFELAVQRHGDVHGRSN